MVSRNASNKLSPKAAISKQPRRHTANGSNPSTLERVSIEALLNPNFDATTDENIQSSFEFLSNLEENRVADPPFEELHYLQLPSIREEQVLESYAQTEEIVPPAAPSVEIQVPQGRSRVFRKYKCQSCNYSFDYLGGLKQHKKAVHEKRKDCICIFEGCNKRYASGGDLRRHVRTVHEKLRPFKCTCHRTFTRKSSLTRHRKSTNCSS